MKKSTEYALCLVRMSLPRHYPSQKLILSIKIEQKQVFLSTIKAVKNQKVNFFRQKVFLKTLSVGIVFEIYSSQYPTQKKFLKRLIVSSDKLTSINKRAAMFHTSDDGYEIVWQCSLFDDQQEFENQKTDRDYSELKTRKGSIFQELLNKSKMQSRLDSCLNNRKQSQFPQRSTSTGGSSNNYSANQGFQQWVSPAKRKKCQRRSISPLRKQKNSQYSTICQRGLSQLFSNFSGGLSGIFSSNH